MVTGHARRRRHQLRERHGSRQERRVVRRQGLAGPSTAPRAYTDPLTEITDQIGVRVVTYLQGDVAAVADLLAGEFSVLDDRDLGQETASRARFGYASRHLLVTLDEKASDPAYAHLRGRSASVQVRTILQHAWAEFEHDVRYKGSVPAADVATWTAGSPSPQGFELADREFTAIRDRLQASAGVDPDVRRRPAHQRAPTSRRS